MKSPCCVTVYIFSVSFVYGEKVNSKEICDEINIFFLSNAESAFLFQIKVRLSPKTHGYPNLTLRVFLRGYTFAMVTTYGTKIITCSLMIEHLCHTITIKVTDKDW